MQQNQTNGLAVGSLVLGIISAICVFLTFTVWMGIVGIICGIVGLILGILARKAQPCGMATAGIVLSAVALGLCVITLISCVACVACAAGAGSLGYLY